MLLKRLVPELRSQEMTGNLAPAITKIERVIVNPKKADEPIDAAPDIIDTPPAETSAKGHGPDGRDPNNSRRRPNGWMND